MLREIYALDNAILELDDGSTIEGCAIDIFDATDDDDNELGFEAIAFEYKTDNGYDIITLDESDIKSFKAS